MRLRGVLVACALAGATSGCGRTVSCEADFGMCHEWVDAHPSLRREIQEAVCRKSDEHYAARPCPRADVVGVCDVPGRRERTLWYRRRAPVDVARLCRETGGTFTPPGSN